MRLASIKFNSKCCVVAEIDEQYLIDIEHLLADTAPAIISMLNLLEQGEEFLARLRSSLHTKVSTLDKALLIDKSKVTWLPPVTRPGKICGVAMNNSASNERKISAPSHPAFFLKPASSLLGHEETLEIRKYYGSVHPEPELAIVIGTEMKDIDAANAMKYIAGYSIFNDITGNGMRAEDLFQYWAIYADANDNNKTRRIEQHLSYAGRYKGTDNFGILGPWLVTKDEIPNPDDLAVSCSVGGEVIAEDSTRYYNYKVAEILSFISQFQTLHPGDIVSCGTAFKPSENRKSIHNANFQVVDGPISISIEGLGTQDNPVRVSDRAIGQWKLK